MSEMDDKELFEIVKNINKIYAGMNVSDYIYFAKNQRHVIEALTPQMRFVQDANRYINYIKKISDSSETKADFFREWVALSEKGMYTQQKYDFDRLADILQGIVVYKTTAEFDKEAVTEAVTEEYIRNEPELGGSGSSLNETDRQEQIKGIRDWVGFWLTVIGFILTVYSREQRAKRACLYARLATAARVKYSIACYRVFDPRLSAQSLQRHIILPRRSIIII